MLNLHCNNNDKCSGTLKVKVTLDGQVIKLS